MVSTDLKKIWSNWKKRTYPSIYLEDHPRTRKWLITMVSESGPSKWPKWLINGGYYVLGGMMLQVGVLQNHEENHHIESSTPPPKRSLLPQNSLGKKYLASWLKHRVTKKTYINWVIFYNSIPIITFIQFEVVWWKCLSFSWSFFFLHPYTLHTQAFSSHVTSMLWSPSQQQWHP